MRDYVRARGRDCDKRAAEHFEDPIILSERRAGSTGSPGRARRPRYIRRRTVLHLNARRRIATIKIDDIKTDNSYREIIPSKNACRTLVVFVASLTMRTYASCARLRKKENQNRIPGSYTRSDRSSIRIRSYRIQSRTSAGWNSSAITSTRT